MPESVAPQEGLGEPVREPREQRSVAVETAATELTQAKRRLQRAIWSAKIEAKIRAEAEGETVENFSSLSTPMLRDMDKLYRDLESFQAAYGLADEEIGE